MGTEQISLSGVLWIGGVMKVVVMAAAQYSPAIAMEAARVYFFPKLIAASVEGFRLKILLEIKLILAYLVTSTSGLVVE